MNLPPRLAAAGRSTLSLPSDGTGLTSLPSAFLTAAQCFGGLDARSFSAGLVTMPSAGGVGLADQPGNTLSVTPFRALFTTIATSRKASG